jgi:hypothetical protein
MEFLWSWEAVTLFLLPTLLFSVEWRLPRYKGLIALEYGTLAYYFLISILYSFQL